MYTSRCVVSSHTSNPILYLQVNQHLTIQAALQVGEVSDQVTVTSTAPMVEATSGVLRETVDRVRVSELPLNGRNVLQLQVLVPGSVSAGLARPERRDTGLCR